MEKFQAAFREVMQAKPVRIVAPQNHKLWVNFDGTHVPRKLTQSV
jgi:hypothetical protein